MITEEKIERPFPDASILLHPNIPKPLHLLNPRTILGVDWWNINRQIAYAKHDYHCYTCGIEKREALYHHWLEAHEMYDINYYTGEVTFIELVALCYCCHNFIHDGRMRNLIRQGKFLMSDYDFIIKRGDKILKVAGFPTKKENYIKIAKENEINYYKHCEWKDWHLVINNINYGQRFKSYEEWNTYFNKADNEPFPPDFIPELDDIGSK